MCLSVNRSRAYSVKDQIIQTIQAHHGIDINSEYDEDSENAFADIVQYLQDSSYRNTGTHPGPEAFGDEDTTYQCFNRQGKSTSRNPVFCIARVDVSSEGGSAYHELPSMVYYRVMTFYNLDLPIFHDLFNFHIVGDTKVIYGGA